MDKHAFRPVKGSKILEGRCEVCNELGSHDNHRGIYKDKLPGPISSMRTRKYKCPQCNKEYVRLSLATGLHPEHKTLPCFDCAKNPGRKVGPIIEGKR